MIQISQTVLQPALQVDASSSIVLRAWYTNSFVAGDGVTPVQGGNGQQGFYYEIVCSLNGSGFVVIPSFNVQETTESNPTAGFFGQLYVDGAPGQMVFGFPQATAGWQIPTIYGAVISFDQLARFNAAVQLLYPPVTFFTANQTIAEIERIAGQFTFAAVGVNGIGQPSVAPGDPSAPIFFGVNDPAVGNLHGSLTENKVPRASADDTLADGLASDDGTDWRIQTVNYVQLGDFDEVAGGTKFEINDSFHLFRLLAARTAGAEHAGIIADAASGDPVVEILSTGLVKISGLPSLDPEVENALWNDAGTIKISAG